jgi:hypothetical protein
VPLCVGASILGVLAASVFREEEYPEPHSAGFLHGIGVCLSEGVVRCAGEVIGFIVYYFLTDCKFDLSSLKS